MPRMVSLIVLAVLLAIVGVLFYQVMIGYFIPVFIAVVLSVIFGPVHTWFRKRCKGRDRLAAGLTTAAILFIVLGPILGIIARATTDVWQLVGQSGGSVQLNTEGLQKLVNDVNERLDWKLSAADIESRAKVWLTQFAGQLPTLLGNLVFGFLVVIFALYYFLADGPEMIQAMTKLLPLQSAYQMELLQQFEEVSRAIVSATLLSALAQGLLAGIGYAIVGLPSVFLLMLLTMIMSMVPLVGSMSVWGSTALYLYLNDHHGYAIFLAIYGAGVVSMADNVVKPIVLGGQSKLHPLWALLSVLGGLQAFGPIGIFIGPLVVAFLQAGLKMFQQELTNLDQRGKLAKGSS